jgi:hypothetical protein
VYAGQDDATPMDRVTLGSGAHVGGHGSGYHRSGSGSAGLVLGICHFGSGLGLLEPRPPVIFALVSF